MAQQERAEVDRSRPRDQVSAVDLCVVGQLARLPEARVKGLSWLPVALQAIRLEHVSTQTRQDDDVTVAALEWDSFEKARLLKMSKALPCRLKVPLTVEHITQVIGVDDPKRSDRGLRLALLPVQLVGALPVSHELVALAARQVDMASEDTPPVGAALRQAELQPRPRDRDLLVLRIGNDLAVRSALGAAQERRPATPRR